MIRMLTNHEMDSINGRINDGQHASGSTAAAWAMNASCAMRQYMPNSAATEDTGRVWSPIASAARRRARVVIRARAGTWSGRHSVNTACGEGPTDRALHEVGAMSEAAPRNRNAAPSSA